MKKNLNYTGMAILITIFVLFYLISNFYLTKNNHSKKIEIEPVIKEETINKEEYTKVINNLYSDVRIFYDVVNNKFKVNQEETITVGNNIYKKITNFDEVTNSIFTENGKQKYIYDLDNYFAKTEEGYYIIANLVSYQTYYFRGNNTNIYILNANEEEINAIIYEKWESNNKNTLATIKAVKVNEKWLIDDLTILSSE